MHSFNKLVLFFFYLKEERKRKRTHACHLSRYFFKSNAGHSSAGMLGGSEAAFLKKKKKNLLTRPLHLFPPLFRTCTTKKTAPARLPPVPEGATVCANPRHHPSGACRTVVSQERPGKQQADIFYDRALTLKLWPTGRESRTLQQNHKIIPKYALIGQSVQLDKIGHN